MRSGDPAGAGPDETEGAVESFARGLDRRSGVARDGIVVPDDFDAPDPRIIAMFDGD